MSKTKAVLKKVFWIVLGVVGVILSVIFILPLFSKDKKTKETPIRKIIEKTKLEIDKAEITAQVEIAKAEGKEEAVIKQLEDIKTEKDRKRRLERLSQLLD